MNVYNKILKEVEEDQSIDKRVLTEEKITRLFKLYDEKYLKEAEVGMNRFNP